MIFSQGDLEQLQREYQAVSGKCQRLVEGYVRRTYNNSRAQEFARQGLARRLQTLARCIEKIFEILPPNRIELPSSEELSDAAINIQAFVINVFGSIDNLAWICVHEKSLTKNDGSPIPKSLVGLRENNELVRGHLSLEFRAHLRELNGWFHNLENIRHALAHRIPLYVPPYIVPDDRLAAYQVFENRMMEASNRGDVAAYERLSAEQKALAVFNPIMTHSFIENADFVEFHRQLLTDFSTIEELGQRMLEELDR